MLKGGKRALLAAVAVATGCELPCRSPRDCPFGSHCAVRVSGSQTGGVCTEECLQASDCPAPTSLSDRAVCDDEGRCRVVPRRPRLRLRRPEPGETISRDATQVTVLGEVVSGAPEVLVAVRPVGTPECPGGPERVVRVGDDREAFRVLPFTVDRVAVEPKTRLLEVVASIGGVTARREIPVQVECLACPMVRLDQPGPLERLPTTSLPLLRGSVSPPPPVAAWRVRGQAGGLLDGRLPLDPNGSFRVENLPLFAGTNQVEVGVSGAASTRCSTVVVAPGQERGLTMVLTWEGAGADLDLHLVGPGGRYGDPSSSLSARTPRPSFGGTVEDGIGGIGPDVIRLTSPDSGRYGVVVEPVFGGAEGLLRVFFDGVPVVQAPLGPEFLDADTPELWIVGTVAIEGSDVRFTPLGQRLPVDLPPVQPPEAWPTFR